MEKKSKQIIVMRTDLNMRKGKMIAQGAHASMKVLLDNSYPRPYGSHNFTGMSEEQFNKILEADKAVDNWLKGSFTKICVSVGSEQELLDIYNKAKESGLLCALIQDSGATEFKGVPTYTCCAIGPNWSEEIDLITGNLKLL